MNHLLRSLTALLLSAALLIAAVPAAEAEVFYDVDSDDWFAAAVEYVTEQALFYGLSTGYFAPTRSMNRAMFYTVLCRMTGEEVTNAIATNLSDVPADQWYTGAIVWVISSGIADCREDGVFGVQEDIPRWEICLAFARYDRLAGGALPTDAETTFCDLDGLDEETCAAIAACQAAGIVQGRSEECFDPMSSANRAQVAQMVSSFHRLLKVDSSTAPSGQAAVPWDTVTGWTGLVYVDFPLSFVDEITYSHVLWLNERILAENTPAAIAPAGSSIDGNARHLTNYGALGLHDCVNTTTCLSNIKNGLDAGVPLSGRQEYYGYSLQVRGIAQQDRWHQEACDTGKDAWQCTWWAWGRAAQYVELAHGQDLTTLCGGRTNLGNGGDYYANLRSSFLSDQTPSANSIISWQCGSYGHVAYVEAVDENGIWVSMADSGHAWRGITYIVKTTSAVNPYPLYWYAYEKLCGFNHLDFAADGTPLS